MTVNPPRGMRADARRAWRELVAALGRDPVAAELVALEAAAAQVARMRDARARIDSEGEVVLGSRDQPVAHPAIAVERAAQAEVRKWLEALGLGAAKSRGGRPRGAVSAPDRVAASEPARVSKLRAVQ